MAKEQLEIICNVSGGKVLLELETRIIGIREDSYVFGNNCGFQMYGKCGLRGSGGCGVNSDCGLMDLSISKLVRQ